MKIHDKLDGIFNRGSKVKVLRFLFREEDEHTGRRIARAVGLSPSLTHSALAELASERLIEVKEKGRSKLYRLRKDNIVVKKLLIHLFESERGLYGDLLKEVKKGLAKAGEGVVTLAVFGSVAAKREAVGSDFDLLVVVENTAVKKTVQGRIDRLGVSLAERYGIALSPYIVVKGQLKGGRSKILPLIKSIQSNYKLIYGEPLERLMA